MDAARALADLTEISSQIEAAVVLDQDGSLLGSTVADQARADELAGGVRELLAAAERAAGDQKLAQVEVATTEGSVFVVRDDERTIAATTTPEPTVGLVFYDLKSCLRSVAESDEAKPKRRTRKKTEESSAAS